MHGMQAGLRGEHQPACKPGSVWRDFSHVAAIPLGRRLPGASGSQPGRRSEDRIGRLRARAVPIRPCSRWGLPCRSRCRSRGGLLPHRFTLTRARAGGLISVALSLGSPPPDVIRHRVSVEPGLSSMHKAPRPPGRLVASQWAFAGRASRLGGRIPVGRLSRSRPPRTILTTGRGKWRSSVSSPPERHR